MIRRLAGFLLAFHFAVVADATAADVEGTVSMISRAGEQRMLAQRITKSYSQIGLNVMPAVASSQMTASMMRFEANLAALKAVTVGSPELAKAHERLGEEWLALRQAASAAVSRDAAMRVSRQAEAVLLAAERMTRTIEDESRSAAGRLVNLAGRQRMLSQRIAKDYMLLSWGVESSALREEMESAISEFSGALARLRSEGSNSDQIRAELADVAQQWEWLQAALAVEGTDSYRLVVAEAADAILEATDRITGLYEQLANY